MGTPAAALLAVVGILAPLNGDARTLTRFDPLSLRPMGPRITLPEYHDAWSHSPDRSRLALGMGGAGRTCGRGICLVDVRDMEIVGRVAAPIAVEALAWMRPRRIVAALQARHGVIVVDPTTGAIVRHTPLPLSPRYGAWARTPAGLAFLTEGRLLRLVVADAAGDVRIAPLPRIRPRRSGFPGFAVDRRGRRALVFAGRAPAAEVDLRTMEVRYHRVAGHDRGGDRARPEELAGAVWLGKGLVAVFGHDPASAPAGVHIVDTRTWRVRIVDRNASRARLAAGRLLVYSDVPAPRAAGVGLRVFTRDGGRLVSHLLGRQVLEVEVAGGRAYAYRAAGTSRALHVVRTRSGTIIRTTRPPSRAHEVDLLGRP